jgi:hypothetical protein
MQEKTTAQQQKTSTLESNEQMTSKKPPVFQLSADGGDGGGGGKGGSDNDRSGLKKVEGKGTPFAVVPVPAWPGEVSWVHSPCFSQEIEEIVITAEGNSEMYLSASAAIEEKINYCKTNEFKNAKGEVNTYAKDRLQGTVPMNKNNLAASSWGKGWPKLVILTFWNDDSKREEGGMNYSYFFYFPLGAITQNTGEEGWSPPDGLILKGPQGASTEDLGHKASEIAEINEWIPILVNAFSTLTNFAKENPADAQKLSEWLKKMGEQGQLTKKIEEKAGSMADARDDSKHEKEQKEEFAKEKFVWIEGNQLNIDSLYLFNFHDNTGKRGTITCTPGYFRDKQLSRGYKYIKHDIDKSQ